MADFTIKRNDHGAAQPLEATLSDTGGAIDLTTAETVRILLKSASLLISTSAMEVVAAEEGKVKYEWEKGEGETPADTATAGEYEMEFEITWEDGSVQTVPNEKAKNPKLLIDEDLGP